MYLLTVEKNISRRLKCYFQPRQGVHIQHGRDAWAVVESLPDEPTSPKTDKSVEIKREDIMSIVVVPTRNALNLRDPIRVHHALFRAQANTKVWQMVYALGTQYGDPNDGVGDEAEESLRELALQVQGVLLEGLDTSMTAWDHHCAVLTDYKATHDQDKKTKAENVCKMEVSAAVIKALLHFSGPSEGILQEAAVRICHHLRLSAALREIRAKPDDVQSMVQSFARLWSEQQFTTHSKTRLAMTEPGFAVQEFVNKTAHRCRLLAHIQIHFKGVVEGKSGATAVALIHEAEVHKGQLPDDCKKIVAAARTFQLITSTAVKVKQSPDKAEFIELCSLLSSMSDACSVCPSALDKQPDLQHSKDVLKVEANKLQLKLCKAISISEAAANRVLKAYGVAKQAAETWDFSQCKRLVDSKPQQDDVAQAALALTNARAKLKHWYSLLQRSMPYRVWMTKAMVDQLNIFYETFPSLERHIAYAARSIGIARLVQAIVRHEATGEPEMSEKARKDFDEVVAYVSNICGVALNGEKLDIPPLLKSKLDSLLPESKTATGKGVKDSSAQAAME